jgi:MFS family permease
MAVDPLSAVVSTDAPSNSRVLAELMANWRPLAACIIGVFLGTLPSYAIGAFLQPVSRELNISLTAVLGWSLSWSVGVVAAAPVAGFLADRYGAKRVALSSLVALAAVLAWSTWGVATRLTWYASGAAIGIAVAGIGGITFGRIVSTLFERGLGTALGLMSTGVGLAAVIGPRSMQAIIDAYGWRVALAVEAAIIVVALPLIARWLASPAPGTVPVPSGEGETVRQAVRRPVFWLLATGTLLYGLCVAGVSVNLIPYLSEQGLSRAAAAGAVGIFGGATVIGRLATGIIIDKAPLHAAAIIAVVLISEAAAFVALAVYGTAALVPALLAFGIAVGAEVDCLAYLVARFFGRRHFSSLFGLLGVVALYIGTGAGPALFNLTRELLASYPSALVLWAAMAVASAVAFAATIRTPFFAAREQRPHGH